MSILKLTNEVEEKLTKWDKKQMLAAFNGLEIMSFAYEAKIKLELLNSPIIKNMYNYLKKSKSVTISKMSNDLNISRVTLYKYLDTLEELELVKRDKKYTGEKGQSVYISVHNSILEVEKELKQIAKAIPEDTFKMYAKFAERIKKLQTM